MAQGKIVDITVVNQDEEQPKQRKPRTSSYEGRLAILDTKIMNLESLIRGRQSLIEAAEAVVTQRRDALKKNEDLLQDLYAKKERLIAHKDDIKGKLNATADEKAQLAELLAFAKASGKSVEEIIRNLKGQR